MISSELVSIVAPALAAGVVIAITHALLGIEVLRRGIIFIDLAVAQVAGLGLVAAGMLHAGSPWVMQLTALASAMLAGLFFRKVELAMPQHQEAIIGVSFVLAASLSILLLAGHPHGGDTMRNLLSGQMLFVTWSDLLYHFPVYALVLAAWFVRPDWRTGLGFYVLFALAITSSVQLVGVYVVFASLILPALAAVGAKRPYIMAWSCGGIAVLSGVAVSALSDLPAGPLLVASYSITAVALRLLFKGRQGTEAPG